MLRILTSLPGAYSQFSRLLLSHAPNRKAKHHQNYFLLVMAALWNRAGHYIFALWFLLLHFFFFSSPNLSGRRVDVYHTSTRCGFSANLGSKAWDVLHMARWKYRMQKWRKKSPSRHHRATLLGCIFATKVYIDNRKKSF